MQIARKAIRERDHDKIKERNRRDYEKFKELRNSRPSQQWTARRNGFYVRTYGISIQERDAMLATQGNACGICGSETPGRTDWHTDHDHNIGKSAVRGILCYRCNTTLGQLGDNLDSVRNWTERALAYLEAANARLSSLADVKRIKY